MKYLLISTLLLFGIFRYQPVAAQCDDEDFMDGCAELLGEFVFVKSFAVNAKAKETKEFSYVFSKGTTYIITICDMQGNDNKMIAELSDRGHKKVASSYIKSSGKHYKKFAYPCKATGVYYLKYKFKKGKPACGVSILGFNKH